MAKFPIINGHLFSFASAEIDFGGKSVFCLAALNWKEELTPEDQYGNDAVAIGRTKGQYKASADYEQYLHEHAEMIARLGQGYGERPFNIGCQYVEVPGAGRTVVEIIGARIAAPEVSNASGPAGTKVKCTLSVIEPIKINGLTLVQRKAQGLQIGVSIGGFTTGFGVGGF